MLLRLASGRCGLDIRTLAGSGGLTEMLKSVQELSRRMKRPIRRYLRNDIGAHIHRKNGKYAAGSMRCFPLVRRPVAKEIKEIIPSDGRGDEISLDAVEWIVI